MSLMILLVSRCQDCVETLKRGLIASGLRDVLIAKSQDELTAMLASNVRFDIAIIHVDQDCATDLECLYTIQQSVPDAACIIVSSLNDADLATECIERGAFDYITMPFSKDTLASRLKKAAAYKMPAGSKPRFLILEDDPVSGKLMEKYLNPFGDCTLVVDGKEAIHTFERSVCDGGIYQLILLDIMVPEIHGKDVLKRIREIEELYSVPRGRRSRVIMTSALSDTSNVVESFKSKCDSYLVKPIDRNKLIHELAELGFDTSSSTNTRIAARVPENKRVTGDSIF